MKTMHLFAGGGGGLLADLILGHEPIVAVEWDAYCCKILRERALDGWFEGLHVWEGDVRLFNPSEYEGRVDIIHAGFPCQDISQAGKQAGLKEGTRSGLYREVLRIAGVVRPKYLFMENVSAILSNGLGTVLADLAALGYDSRYCCIRASDVGAPHGRDRWWLRAERSGLSPHTEHDRDGWGQQQPPSIEKATGNVANTNSIRHIHSQSKINTAETRINAQRDAASSSNYVYNTTSFGLQGQGQQPNSVSQKAQRQGQANNAQSNNAPWWEIEPDVGKLVNELAFEMDGDKI